MQTLRSPLHRNTASRWGMDGMYSTLSKSSFASQPSDDPLHLPPMTSSSEVRALRRRFSCSTARLTYITYIFRAESLHKNTQNTRHRATATAAQQHQRDQIIGALCLSFSAAFAEGSVDASVLPSTTGHSKYRTEPSPPKTHPWGASK
jgi:hypothetical protein